MATTRKVSMTAKMLSHAVPCLPCLLAATPESYSIVRFFRKFPANDLGGGRGTLYATIDSELGASLTKNNTVHFLPHTRFESLCQLDASGLSRTLPIPRMEVLKFTPNEKMHWILLQETISSRLEKSQKWTLKFEGSQKGVSLCKHCDIMRAEPSHWYHIVTLKTD